MDRPPLWLSFVSLAIGGAAWLAWQAWEFVDDLRRHTDSSRPGRDWDYRRR